MLKSKLIHPQILSALGRAGHGSRILIADGNYPYSSKLGPRADLVNLNLSPGVVSCTQVLESVVSAVPIEAAAVMAYATTEPHALAEDPPIWAEFHEILKRAGAEDTLTRIERFVFYEAASQPDVVITIATGDQRLYANLLLTIGVVLP